jgi:hypothetical protein
LANKASKTEEGGWKNAFKSALKDNPWWLAPVREDFKRGAEEAVEGNVKPLLTKFATMPIDPREGVVAKGLHVLGEAFRGAEDLSEAGVAPSAATVMRPVSAMVGAETPEARSAAKSKADLDALFD